MSVFFKQPIHELKTGVPVLGVLRNRDRLAAQAHVVAFGASGHTANPTLSTTFEAVVEESRIECKPDDIHGHDPLHMAFFTSSKP